MKDNKIIEPDYNLLAKYFANESSVEESNIIESWVAEGLMNKKAYDRMYFLWMQTSKNEYCKSFDVDKAWQKMQFRLNASSETDEKSLGDDDTTISTYKRTLYRFLQLAAIVVIGFAIHYFVNFDNYSDNYTAVTASSGTELIILSDNSKVKLSKLSKIYYPKEFTGNQRLVKLDGEAFFDVSSDKYKPFIIEAQFAKVKVVGTSFNVKALDKEGVVEVSVVSGTVELSSINSDKLPMLISAGEKGIISAPDQNAIRKVSIANAPKKIIFKNTKLTEVASTLRKAYNVDIEFSDKYVKDFEFSLVMYDMSIDTVMEELEKTNNKIVITKVSDKKFKIGKR